MLYTAIWYEPAARARRRAFGVVVQAEQTLMAGVISLGPVPRMQPRGDQPRPPSRVGLGSHTSPACAPVVRLSPIPILHPRLQALAKACQLLFELPRASVRVGCDPPYLHRIHAYQYLCHRNMHYARCTSATVQTTDIADL
jgi:hypothetical protein